MTTAASGISARALAKLLGVSHTAVNEAVAAGRLRRNEAGRFDPPAAIRDWHENRRQLPSAEGAKPGEGPTIARLQQADFALKVEERKLRVDERKSRLIDRARAKALVRRLAQEEREAILAFPTRWAALMAARLKVDQHELQTVLDEALRTHLAERAGSEVDL